jgi:hypothetical protein
VLSGGHCRSTGAVHLPCDRHRWQTLPWQEMNLTALLGEVLPFAIAAALTPTAILAGLLLMLTQRPRRSGGAYLAGWTLGLLLSAFVLLRLGAAPAAGEVVLNEPLFRPGIILVAGIALLVSGALAIRGGRPKSREPAWMRRVHSLAPGHAFGIGFILAGLSPKILLLTAATVVALVFPQSPGSGEAVGLALYILIASLPIAVPVVIVFVEGERAPQRLQGWKEWLIRNQAGVLGGGAFLLGLLLIGRALSLASGVL